MKPERIVYASMLILTMSLFVSCTDETQEAQEIIRPVRYQQVAFLDREQTRKFSGVSQAGTKAKLSFRVGGVVERVNIKVGQVVKEGVLIASLDDSDARLNYEKALSSLTMAETQKDNARSNLVRVRDLYENNNVPLSEYEAAKDQYARADSAENTEKRNADLRKRELGYYTLYAPMDGIINEVNMERNEQVSIGKVVAEISSGDDIEVSVGVPEAFISDMNVGGRVSVKFLSLAGKTFNGTITEVSFAAGTQTSTYPVIVRIENPAGNIWSGMPADVTFIIAGSAQETRRLVVPDNAVGEDAGGNFVFTVTDARDGLAVVHKTSVKVGVLTRQGFEILEGLQEGELVVTAGIVHLTDAMEVRVLK